MTETALPTDAFDRTLAQLIGLPNGAHTDPTVVQAQDFYGNTTAYIVQTVKWDEGDTTFVTVVNAEGSRRFILPPTVLRTIDRQREAALTKVRRRHGKRLADERLKAGVVPGFTAEQREKALKARRANARKRAARRRR